MSKYFTWLDEYRIGNDTIDKQHQYLFDLANRIVDPTNDQQKTHHNVLALNHYVTEHFKNEEALMKQCDYSGYEEQVKAHDLLTKRLAEFSYGIIRDEVAADEVMKFMRNWLLDHILGKDVLLGDFLSRRDDQIEQNAEPIALTK